MANTEIIGLRRAKNFRVNLRRVFDAWAVQLRVADEANIHSVHLARILNGSVPNPTIDTLESISIALEIPLEILLANEPSDADLRIFAKSLKGH